MVFKLALHRDCGVECRGSGGAEVLKELPGGLKEVDCEKFRIEKAYEKFQENEATQQPALCRRAAAAAVSLFPSLSTLDSRLSSFSAAAEAMPTEASRLEKALQLPLQPPHVPSHVEERVALQEQKLRGLVEPRGVAARQLARRSDALVGPADPFQEIHDVRVIALERAEPPGADQAEESAADSLPSVPGGPGVRRRRSRRSIRRGTRGEREQLSRATAGQPQLLEGEGRVGSGRLRDARVPGQRDQERGACSLDW